MQSPGQRGTFLQDLLGGESVASCNGTCPQASACKGQLTSGTTFADFFAGVTVNPATSITGSVEVQDVDDPLMRQIRYPCMLTDELAKGATAGEGAGEQQASPDDVGAAPA